MYKHINLLQCEYIVRMTVFIPTYNSSVKHVSRLFGFCMAQMLMAVQFCGKHNYMMY